jgi:bacterioferritin
VPNMQRYFPVKVGEDAIEQHRLDLEVEYDAVKRLNGGITLCRDKGDNGTRELLETILTDEEDGIDWLEAQLHLVETIGPERYLAEQMDGGN